MNFTNTGVFAIRHMRAGVWAGGFGGHSIAGRAALVEGAWYAQRGTGASVRSREGARAGSRWNQPPVAADRDVATHHLQGRRATSIGKAHVDGGGWADSASRIWAQARGGSAPQIEQRAPSPPFR